MGSESDFELIERFSGGQENAFNELVRRYQEKVYWIARRMLGSHDDADDVVQEVFVRVYEHLSGFRGDANFYTWIYRITVNLSLNAARKRRLKDFLPYDDFDEQIDSGAEAADSRLLSSEYTTILEKAIELLPPKQKAVFIMRYYDEIPYEEMARILKKSEGGLKANYFHALKKIQEYVRKEMSS